MLITELDSKNKRGWELSGKKKSSVALCETPFLLLLSVVKFYRYKIIFLVAEI